jgi:hypothetical protein
MSKEHKTATEPTSMIEKRIGHRAKVTVMPNHPINNWYAMVTRRTHILQIQDDVNRISDVLGERYDLKTSKD